MLNERIPTEEELRAMGSPAIDFYLDHIADSLTDSDKGRYIAIDMNTGEWEIDDTEDVSNHLRARNPEARIHVIRHILIVSEHLLTPYPEVSAEKLNLASRQLADDAEEFGQ